MTNLINMSISCAIANAYLPFLLKFVAFRNSPGDQKQHQRYTHISSTGIAESHELQFGGTKKGSQSDGIEDSQLDQTSTRFRSNYLYLLHYHSLAYSGSHVLFGKVHIETSLSYAPFMYLYLSFSHGELSPVQFKSVGF